MSYSIQSPKKILRIEATVNELIDEETKEWKETLVNKSLIKEEALQICRMLKSKMGMKYRLIWGFCKDGKFFVKSVYHVTKTYEKTYRG